MKEFKGTKGKWSVDKRAALRVTSDEDITVASASAGQSGDNREEEMANAKLIAAAPDLLEACQLIIESFGYYDLELTDEEGIKAIKSAEKAINKALTP